MKLVKWLRTNFFVLGALAYGVSLTADAHAQSSSSTSTKILSNSTETHDTGPTPGVNRCANGARNYPTCTFDEWRPPAGGTAATAPATSFPINGIVSSVTGALCLDVVGADTYGAGKGAVVDVWRCDVTPNVDLQWVFKPVLGADGKDTGYVQVVNTLKQWCLDVSGVDLPAKLGASVGLYSVCGAEGTDAGLDRQWKIEPVGDTLFRLRNRANGLCLGLRGVDQPRDGTLAEVYSCTPTGTDPLNDALWAHAGPS